MSIIDIPEKTIEEQIVISYTYNAYRIDSIIPLETGIKVVVYLYNKQDGIQTNLPDFIRQMEYFIDTETYVNFTPADLNLYIQNLLL